MILFLVLSKLVQGPGGGGQSLAGFEICDAGSIVALFVLILSSVPMTFLAAKIATSEYH